MASGRGRAVVIGASIAGVSAASALADHFAEVVVIDRDRLPACGEHRKGVPQSRHAHGLLARGREDLERLFPGLTDRLAGAGALAADNVADGLWYMQNGYHARPRTGLHGMLQSRVLLEGTLRAMLAERSNVRLRDRTDVIRPLYDAANRRVAGVALSSREGGMIENLPADLVVDASGRGSRAPEWLTAWGYPAPPEMLVKSDVAYTSRVYPRRPGDIGGARFAVVTTVPPVARGAALLAIEGERWHLTLFGLVGDAAPPDEEGFRAYAASLPTGDILGIVASRAPIGETARYGMPGSRRRFYERLDRFPDGFLVFGDAICSFNPTFGQGMTVAAAQAVALRTVLAQGRAGLGLRFFRVAGKLVDSPWRIAASADWRFDRVPGERARGTGIVNAWLDRVHLAAHSDPLVALAFHRVANLYRAPTSLFAPSVVLRVVAHSLRRAITLTRGLPAVLARH